MIRSHSPATVFIVLGAGVGRIFTMLNGILGPRRRIDAKTDPYECGLIYVRRRGALEWK